MTRQEFEANILAGDKLVLLDNLVLDVAEFINHHPGGKFVIRHTIGGDVGKFFFGGYNLEDNTTSVARGHIHSNYAKMIVNDLAIATYEEDIPMSTEIVQ
jgi:cytochrome b involved in lipid metabolism